MSKTCPEHGTFTATHWQSPAVYNHTEEYDFFKKFPESENAGKFPGCPYTCQDCTSHVSDTVIGVIDVILPSLAPPRRRASRPALALYATNSP